MLDDRQAPTATDSTAFYDQIAEILMTLSEFTEFDKGARLRVDLPEDDPLAALFRGVNQMLDSLQEAERQAHAQQEELAARLRTIEEQRLAIQELSTPLIEVWDGVLCMPVVGLVDTVRSAEMTESLLQAVVDNKARLSIIDITGIDVMDTGTADHFIRMAKAVRLLGAKCILSGVNPAIAQTLVHIGVDLTTLETHRSLSDALQVYVARQRNAHRS